MRFRKSLTSILLAAVGGLTGCTEQNEQNDMYKPRTISGLPISVAGYYARYSGAIAIVIEIEGKKILAYNETGRDTLQYAKANALIQSEISDGDNEKIELSGNYINNSEFLMKSVKANGHRVNFLELE